MEFNNKKLEKTSKLTNYVIAIVLCGFLISLFERLIIDVHQWNKRPTIERFQNTELLKEKKSAIEKIKTKIELKREKKSSIVNTIKIINSNYDNAKKSFDNWLEARKTVGSRKEDKEILSRANELDKFYKIQQKWKKELSNVNNQIISLNKDKNKIDKLLYEEKNRAYKKQVKALRKYNLKVFLIRLLIILPILILGIIFIIKFRKHKYQPLFLGFVLFSVYTFFFGLIPYLPSYGQYIRYAVGIILSILLGGYVINKIKAFIEQKKNELKISTTERAKRVQIQTAEKALDNHMCPSCGKDFIVKKWDESVSKKSKTKTCGIVTNFCRFCGLELFKKCNTCDSKNFAHLPFCSNCGGKMTDKRL